MTAFVIKMKGFCVWWEFDEAVFPVSASNAIRHFYEFNNNNSYYYYKTAIGLSPGGSGYFTCTQNMKLVNNKFKSGGLPEKHVVATWFLGNHLRICLGTISGFR